ncbi:penicillin-binding protein, partial [Microgenomates group bacterium]|nr:penicillin-binding protein [Microgenomates group bacterium]
MKKKISLRSLLPNKKRDSKVIWRLKLARLLSIIFALGVLLIMIVFTIFFFYFNSILPSPNNVVRQSGFSTKIYDRHGALLYDVYGDARREPIDFDQISERMKQATIAIEDKDFYHHKGFDLLTVLRLPYYYLTRQRVVGGSTLTQQLIKNMLLSNERTVTRKFKEIILSMQLESYYDKDEILHLYLSEAPYGGNVYGVGTAAKVYFNKPASELTIAEAAILAGLPQSPSAYSPFAGRTNSSGELMWRARAQGVLRRMVEDSYLSHDEYLSALEELNEISFEKQVSSINAPHFVFYVKDLLAEMYGEEMAEAGGLSITTSLDLELQNDVQVIVAEEVEKIAANKVSNGASLVMAPQTGEILAMVGSVDFFSKEIDGQFNMIVDGLRQPGSSIKPLTYLAFLQQGATAETLIADVSTSFASTDFDQPYRPQNYNGRFNGPVTLRFALGNSLNIPAVKALAHVGLPDFLQLAFDAGISTFEPTAANLKRFGLAVTLGGAEVRMLELTSAYSAFATSGKKVAPVAILKVEDRSGRVIYEHKHAQQKQVFSPGETYLINDILSEDASRAYTFGAGSRLNASRNIAVKTGTTNDLRDNWTVGWNKNFIVNAWVGNNDNSPMGGLVSGISGATPIWRRVIDRLLELGYKADPFDVPDNIETIEVDRISGYRAHDGFETKMAKFVRGTISNDADPIHVRLKVCHGEDKLATAAQIAAGGYDEKEYIIIAEFDPYSQDGKNRWQEGIDNWKEGADGIYRPPTEMCGDNRDLYVRLEGLDNERNYSETKLRVKVVSDSGVGVESSKIIVNGETKKECSGRECELEIDFGSGRFEVWGSARSRDGKEAASSRFRIGTGGQSWNNTPSPTPSPSPLPPPLTPPTPSPPPPPP